MKLKTLKRILREKNAERDLIKKQVELLEAENNGLSSTLSSTTVKLEVESRKAARLTQEIDQISQTLSVAKREKTAANQRLNAVLAELPPNSDGIFKSVFVEQKEQCEAYPVRGHTQIALKCFDCSLHFVILTWWADRERECNCPECGGANIFHLGQRSFDHEIYEHCDFLNGACCSE